MMGRRRKIRNPACSWIRNLWFAVVEVVRPAGVAVEHDQIRVAEGRNKHSVLFLINGYLATRDYAGEGLLRASGKAAIDTCGGGLVRQPVTLVALQVEPSKLVTFIVKRFTTKTVFVSNSTRIVTGDSRTGTIALGEQSVVS